MVEDVNLALKVCLLGDSSVGKTSLIRKYVYDIFDDNYLMTMGTKVTKKELSVQIPENGTKFNVTFMIWDIIGDFHFRGLLHHSYLHGANGALFVCDITRPETLKNLNVWVDSVNSQGNKGVSLIFIANKSDLIDEEKFDKTEIKRLAAQNNSSFMLTSAKTGANVENTFSILCEKMIKKYISKRESQSQ